MIDFKRSFFGAQGQGLSDLGEIIDKGFGPIMTTMQCAASASLLYLHADDCWFVFCLLAHLTKTRASVQSTAV